MQGNRTYIGDATTRFYKTGEPLQATVIQRHIPWADILICNEAVQSGVQILLGEYYSQYAQVQMKWLMELGQLQELPPVLDISQKKLKAYLRAAKETIGKTESPDDLKTRALILFKSQIGTLIRRAPAKLTIARTSSPSKMSSAVILSELLMTINAKVALIRLQEIFMLLSCHVMHTTEEYTALVSKSRYWKGSDRRKKLPVAETFIYLLLRRSPDDLKQCLSNLVQRYPDGDIKVSDWKGLIQGLDNLLVPPVVFDFNEDVTNGVESLTILQPSKRPGSPREPTVQPGSPLGANVDEDLTNGVESLTILQPSKRPGSPREPTVQPGSPLGANVAQFKNNVGANMSEDEQMAQAMQASMASMGLDDSVREKKKQDGMYILQLIGLYV